MFTGCLNILLIQDNPEDARLIQEMLHSHPRFACTVTHTPDLHDGIASARLVHPSAVILYLPLPDSKGIQPLVEFQRQIPDEPTIVISSAENDDIQVQSIQAGAQDYLIKGKFDAEALVRSLRYAIERHALQAQLAQLSLIDDLTGLYNRRGFFTLAQQQMDLARRNRRCFSVIYADVDYLKPVNDAYGHQMGDQVVKDIAAVLRRTFRSTDVVARLGGDEFAVLAIDTVEEQEYLLSTRLQSNITRFNETEDRPYQLSVSLGIVTWAPQMVEQIDDLLSRADRRMYRQKLSRKKFIQRWEPDPLFSHAPELCI